MNDSSPSSALPGGKPEPPRLGPRPLERPDVDDADAAVFGRPPGVPDGFVRSPAPSGSPVSSAAPPPAALALAFGRPATGGAALQRPPGEHRNGSAPDPFWDAGAAADPWRSPETSVELGRPGAELPGSSDAPLRAGPRLSLREVLFGRRVQARALAALAVVALLVGAVGGLVGRLTAEGASSLTKPDPTITQVTAATQRPPGSVADIAARTVPAVVSIEIRVVALLNVLEYVTAALLAYRSETQVPLLTPKTISGAA